MSQPPYDPYSKESPQSDPYPTQQFPAVPAAPVPPGYGAQPPVPYQPAPYQPAPNQLATNQAPGYGPPAYPPPGYGYVYPEPSQATVALVLGILGITVAQITAPFAWWLGLKEKRAIDAGRRDPVNRGQAVAGWILGIVGTVLLGLAVLFVVGYFAFIAVILGGAAAGSGGFSGMFSGS